MQSATKGHKIPKSGEKGGGLLWRADQTEKAKGKLSQTGDMIPLTIIAVVAITAGILVVVVTLRNRRESREDEEGDVR